MVVATQHRIAGEVKTIGSPVKFHGTPGGVKRAAPVLGQHSREVLAEAGYSSEEIEALIASGAVVAATLD